MFEAQHRPWPLSIPHQLAQRQANSGFRFKQVTPFFSVILRLQLQLSPKGHFSPVRPAHSKRIEGLFDLQVREQVP